MTHPGSLEASAMSVSRTLDEAALLAQCRVDQYRGSGPGGQKRNKTSNAVRITHLATGIAATATEDRSLSVNRLHAVRRIRVKLAVGLREPVDLGRFEPPDWLLEIRRNGRLEVSVRHPLYPAVLGLTLDLLAATHGNPAHAAANLGVSTTTVIRLLESETHAWTAANAIRRQFSEPPLTHRS